MDQTHTQTHKQKFTNFVKYGLMLKVFSIFTNFIFYQYFDLDVKNAYTYVLILDFFLAFILNYYFVFKVDNSNLLQVIIKFIAAGVGFRFIDMYIYLAVYQLIGNIYASQIISTVIIFVLKYTLYDKIFKSNKKTEKS